MNRMNRTARAELFSLPLNDDELRVGRMIVEWRTCKPRTRKNLTRHAARAFRLFCTLGKPPFVALHTAHNATCSHNRKSGHCRHTREKRAELLKSAREFFHELGITGPFSGHETLALFRERSGIT